MRIRTVKPEFWTHPVLGRQAPEVQLLALGLLNLADDEGYFLADSGLVRAAVCPFRDSIKGVQAMIDALCAVLWVEVRNHPTHGPIGKVVNFTKHQRISRPTESKLSKYFSNSGLREDSLSAHGALTEDSLSAHGGLTEDSLLERKGKERKGKGSEVDALRANWNMWVACDDSPFAKWQAGREKEAKAALTRRPIEQWIEVFKRVAASQVCRIGWNNNPWVADIDWVLRAEGKKPESALLVLEGKFDDKRNVPVERQLSVLV